MLPWLMERGEVPVAEAARRFGLSETEVVSDLELVAMCGLPPFVDELIDVFVDEGTIWIGVPRLFTKPLQLNAVEAWELATAGRAAMQLPGADPDGSLGRGLAKLEAVLGDDAETDVEIDLTPSASVDELADAVQARTELVIDYASAASGETSTRRIVPRRVFADRGHWYVEADDDRSGAVRTFRVDRIERLEATGRIGDEFDGELGELGEWFVDAGLPVATILVAPEGRWVVEQFPVDSVGEPDAAGRVEVSMPVASERWLAETLLALGPNGRLVEPERWRGLAASTAADVLARYDR